MKKKYLQFHIDLQNIPHECQDIVAQFKQIAEKNVYIWKNFQQEMPPSFIEELDSSYGSNNIAGKRCNSNVFTDLFVAPDFDESQELAYDSLGQLQILNSDQLQGVRHRGEFEVISKRFAGQKHQWRLNRLIQKGTDNTLYDLRKDFAKALRFIIITAKNRLIGNYFSVIRSLYGYKGGFVLLFDLLFGIAWNNPGDVESKLCEERYKFLVCELNVKSRHRSQLVKFWEYVRSSLNMSPHDRFVTRYYKPPVPPFFFKTADDQPIDLRLWDVSLSEKVFKIVLSLLQSVQHGWFQEFKEQLVSAMKKEGRSNSEMETEVTQQSKKEYLQRVLNAVANNEELARLDSTIVEPLIAEIKFNVVLREAVASMEAQMSRKLEAHRQRICQQYPILSKVGPWLRERVRQAEHDFLKEHVLDAHETALAACQEAGLHQQAYFLSRDLSFLKDKEQALRKEYMRARYPDRTFRFGLKIWFPRNWRVTYSLYGENHVVQTVLVKDGSEPPKPNLYVNMINNDQKPVYSVCRKRYFESTTRYPFWRWFNFLLRVWCWTWNVMFFTLIIVPWCSPVGLRALFGMKAFYPDWNLCQEDGQLYPSTNVKVLTLCSRLRGLWRQVHKSRVSFESSKDEGFLSKRVTRHFNRFWNYVLKGFVGTFILCIVMPPLCVFCSIWGVLLGLAAPFWMPAFCFALQMLCLLFYDMDKPPQRRNRFFPLFELIIWQLGLRGFGQTIAATLTALCCPLISGIVLLGGVARFSIRSLWDAFTFHALVKRVGRVPAKQDFIARRISGPGLASNYFFKVRREEALLALEAQLELLELDLWREQQQKLVDQPRDDYYDFFRRTWSAFNLVIKEPALLEDKGKDSTKKAPLTRILAQYNSLNSELHRQYHSRCGALQLSLLERDRQRIKLSDVDLRWLLRRGSARVQNFTQTRIMPRLASVARDEALWWETVLNLRQSDYSGLTCQLLAKVFGDQFLTPIEETDVCFELQVQHVTASSYLDMLQSGEFRDDLDAVNLVHTPTGFLNVPLPQLNVNLFRVNCVSKLPTLREVGWNKSRLVRRFKWKRFCAHWATAHALPEIRLAADAASAFPIYHPALIALYIWCREEDQGGPDPRDPLVSRVMEAAISLSSTEHDKNMNAEQAVVGVSSSLDASKSSLQLYDSQGRQNSVDTAAWLDSSSSCVEPAPAPPPPPPDLIVSASSVASVNEINCGGVHTQSEFLYMDHLNSRTSSILASANVIVHMDSTSCTRNML